MYKLHVNSSAAIFPLGINGIKGNSMFHIHYTITIKTGSGKLFFSLYKLLQVS